jgi:nucleoside-diphosphate-sugar epimerase
MQVLVTGASGAIGPAIIAELLRSPAVERVIALLRSSSRQSQADRFAILQLRVSRALETSFSPAFDDRLQMAPGDIAQPFGQFLPKSLTHIVHAAAITRLEAPADEIREVNVIGTNHVLQFALSLPGLSHIVYVSTHCVAGKTLGVIPETLRPEAPEFVNLYERSKWEAEQLVASAELPAQILRLTTCLGRESGEVDRISGVHLAIDWLRRGMIPMVPGTPETPVDLISNETAAKLIARGVVVKPEGVETCHVASGSAAPTLYELLVYLTAKFREQDSAWRRGQIASPSIVSSATFEDFRKSVQQSRDALFLQILDSVDTLLTPLLYPRIYETHQAQKLWGGPLPAVDWQSLLANVVKSLLARKSIASTAHG